MWSNLSPPSPFFGLSSSFHSPLYLFHHEKEVSHTKKQPNPHCKKNPLSATAPQSHTHIHIHPNSSSSPSSHSTASMARKTIHARATSRQEAGSSRKNTKGQEQVPEEEEEESPLPSPQPSPPRRSTLHPSSRSQRTKKPVRHNTREPSNLDSLDFKNKYGKSHSHFDPARFMSCAAFEFHSQVLTVSTALGYQDEGSWAYMSGKWDNQVRISLQVALTRVCESFSALEGTNLTHKALVPVKALLHRTINHILMPQRGSYQRVTVCDTLVFFAILNSSSISFAYLMLMIGKKKQRKGREEEEQAALVAKVGSPTYFLAEIERLEQKSDSEVKEGLLTADVVGF
ncbi:uncharacterized protein DS421_14g469580 [Arachis hypogaea]|nr:uncharacterized protein DS421_14g469580 [Arachis hypogaea]